MTYILPYVALAGDPVNDILADGMRILPGFFNQTADEI
jgi:hypothetical protein